jgi:O-antigen ligase
VYLILQLESTRGALNFCIKIGLLLFVVAGVLLSFSRGAWFNLALASGLYMVLRFAAAKSHADTAGLIRIIGLVVVAILAVAVWAVTTIDDISQMFTIRAQLVQDYDKGSDGRFDAMLIAVKQAMIHPLGIGPGQVSEVLALDPHNLFVHILVETGWLGALSFSCFIVVSLKEAYVLCMQPSQVQKICMVLFACLVATLVESMIIHSTHWRHLYVLFALLWGSIAAKRNHVI